MKLEDRVKDLEIRVTVMSIWFPILFLIAVIIAVFC